MWKYSNMSQFTIYHNPRCSKSRQTLALLEENGIAAEVVLYLDATPSIETLKQITQCLGFQSARDWMRTKEDDYKTLNLKDETDEEKLYQAMHSHPKLIDRPIVIKGDLKNGQAVLGRPPENILTLL